MPTGQRRLAAKLLRQRCVVQERWRSVADRKHRARGEEAATECLRVCDGKAGEYSSSCSPNAKLWLVLNSTPFCCITSQISNCPPYFLRSWVQPWSSHPHAAPNCDIIAVLRESQRMPEH